MSRKLLDSQLSDARAQLAEAQRELELSTFLNKGVLQSNSEFKLRIAELEQENAVLRIAESRLAKTEDKAEAAERRVKEILGQLRDKESEWAGKLSAAADIREGLKAENEMLREEVRGWREVGERVGGIMAQSDTKVVDRLVRREGNAVAGPSRPSQAARATPVPPTVKSATKPESSSSRQRAESPYILVQSTRTTKRRRRIEDSGDQSEDDAADTYAPSSPLPTRTPVLPPRTTTTRTTRASSSSAKKRDTQPTKKGGTTHHKRTPPERTRPAVKIEKRSPARESEESEEDPLYLE